MKLYCVRMVPPLALQLQWPYSYSSITVEVSHHSSTIFCVILVLSYILVLRDYEYCCRTYRELLPIALFVLQYSSSGGLLAESIIWHLSPVRACAWSPRLASSTHHGVTHASNLFSFFFAVFDWVARSCGKGRWQFTRTIMISQ